jgi:hypothetical protein
MLLRYKNIIKGLFGIGRVEKKIDSLMVLTARQQIISNNQLSTISSLAQVEFKVFSQWGDDGIIQYFINKLNISKKEFVEFGVENYRESNTRFLLVNNNWKGLIFDYSVKNIATIQEDEIYWRYDLTAASEFITTENINGLLTKNGFTGNIGLLHIDIDGNDYWIWKAINTVDADIVIMEYNGLWGKEKAVTIPYKADFDAGSAHYSRVYFGSSIKALCDLAVEKGYYFAGCNSAGVNAYFINNRFKGIIPEVSVDAGFVMPSGRQTRNKEGKLDFLSSTEASKLLKGLKVYNVESSQEEEF